MFFFSRDEINASWEELLANLKKRRDRLDRTILLQKIFQAINLLGDSIDETRNALEMAQGSLFIEGKQTLKTDITLSALVCLLTLTN